MAQNALAVVPQQDIQVTSMAELRELAEDAASSRFFGAATPEQAICLMLAGKDLGFSYMQSLRLFHVINSKPTLSADALVAIVKAHPSCEKFHRVSESNAEATWVAKRRGEPEQMSTFTMEDARAAGLLEKKAGNNWQTYPKRMLNARAKAFLARDVWPDLVAGLYSSEEMERPTQVETDVRHVPEPRPTPVPPSGPRDVVDPVLADAKVLVDEMRAAMSLAELSAVVAKVQGFGFPAEVRTILVAEHRTQKARVTPPEDAGDSWEPARG